MTAVAYPAIKLLSLKTLLLTAYICSYTPKFLETTNFGVVTFKYVQMHSFSFKYIQYIGTISSNVFKYVHLVSNTFNTKHNLFIIKSGEHMAKQKLTKAAINFIIEKRNDWNVNYTFDDIANLLKEDFGITITEQAVSKSYRKYKDDKEFQSMPIVATDKETDSNVDTSNMTTKEKYYRKVALYKENKDKPEPSVAKKKIRDFDENAGKGIDISQYF